MSRLFHPNVDSKQREWDWRIIADNNVPMKIGWSHNHDMNDSKQYNNAVTRQQFPEQQSLNLQSDQNISISIVFCYRREFVSNRSVSDLLFHLVVGAT